MPCPGAILRGVNITRSPWGTPRMSLTKPGDEVVEIWLEKLAQYEAAKTEASSAWKDGYIDLARARSERMVSAFDFDGRAEATTRVTAKGILQISEKHAILPSFGVWPPQSLKNAQKSFEMALDAEVCSLRLRKELDRLELEL